MREFSTYLDLCTQVYDLSKPTAPQDAYAFYRKYVAEAQGLVLEPMCGSGRFLIPLVQEGFKVHGFDASTHMLSLLKQKAGNLKPDIWQCLIEDFSSSYRYDLIFIPSGSFGLLAKIEDFSSSYRYDLIFIPSGSFGLLAKPEKVLEIFYHHLTDGGKLVFEIETHFALPELNIWRKSEFIRNDRSIILLSSYATLKDNICSSICKYELLINNQVIQTETEEMKVRIYEQNELSPVLAKAGFKNIRILKAFDHNDIPDSNDGQIVYECIKLR